MKQRCFVFSVPGNTKVLALSPRLGVKVDQTLDPTPPYDSIPFFTSLKMNGRGRGTFDAEKNVMVFAMPKK